MDITTSTVFIPGATSGIGLAIARALTDAGSTVIAGGRSVARLTESFDSVEIDVTDAASVARARDVVLDKHPGLSAVITMSGIMAAEDLRDPAHFATAERTIDTNLLGTIRVVDAFTPHFLRRGAGTIVTVSSGLAYVPFPLTPAYGATKAAVHSYTESLRKQLDGTGVEVAELIPPEVATNLMPGGETSPTAMPLADFVTESVALLATDPTPHEITVDRVKPLRHAVTDGTYDQLLGVLSQALVTLRH
jgi:uncharacterized oxidoreductase